MVLTVIEINQKIMSLGIQVANILCFGALGQVLMACFGASGYDRTSRECVLDTLETGTGTVNCSINLVDEQHPRDITSSGIADVIRRPTRNFTENMNWLLSPDSSSSENESCLSKKVKTNPLFNSFFMGAHESL